MKIQLIKECPDLLQEAAAWFSHKWQIPIEAYLESMEKCIKEKASIPRWYIVLDEKHHIIAGAGVIENDFHKRKDLTPNLCALFVEENYRYRGMAKRLLDFARKDLGTLGYDRVYLVTDHSEFYEKCGWKFFTVVEDDAGLKERMYSATTL